MQNEWQAAPKTGEILAGERQTYESEYVVVWEKNAHMNYWHFIRRYVRSYARMICCERRELAIFPVGMDPNA